MRITHDSMQGQWLVDVQKRLQNLDKYNRNIGSGKKIEKPADDPSGSNRVVQMDELIKRNDQYLKNIEEALQVNSTTETALDQVFSRLTRVKELSIEGSNEASLPKFGTLTAFATEVAGIKDAILDLALSTNEGRYLFNGTAGDTAPYAQGGGAYQGDRNQLYLNLGNDQKVGMNLTGDRAFRETEIRSFDALFENGGAVTVPAGGDLSFTISDGLGVDTSITLAGGASYDEAATLGILNGAFAASGANLTARSVDGHLSIGFVNSEVGGEMAVSSVTGDIKGLLGFTAGVKNVFGLLDDLKTAMDSNDLTEVSRFLGRIDRMSDGVVSQRGQYGSRARNLEFMRDKIEGYNLTSASLKETIEGIDLPETVTKLTAQQQAYETALAAGGRIFNVSLLNYLR